MKKGLYIILAWFPWKFAWIMFYGVRALNAVCWKLWNWSYTIREKVGLYSRPERRRDETGGIEGNGNTFP